MGVRNSFRPPKDIRPVRGPAHTRCGTQLAELMRIPDSGDVLQSGSGKVEKARLAFLNSTTRHLCARKSYVLSSELGSSLAAHKNPQKRRFTPGRCQTGTGKLQCLGKLWAITRLFRMAQARAISRQPFQRIGPARTLPPKPASGSPMRDRMQVRGMVSKKHFCSSPLACLLKK
jgi:hypothetical protein